MGVRSYGSQKSCGLVKVQLSEFYFQSGIKTEKQPKPTLEERRITYLDDKAD